MNVTTFLRKFIFIAVEPPISRCPHDHKECLLKAAPYSFTIAGVHRKKAQVICAGPKENKMIFVIST